LQQINASCDVAARIALMGPFDMRVLSIIDSRYADQAREFASSASTTLWCQSASLALLADLPGSLPPIQTAADSLYREIEMAAAQASKLDTSEEVINSDLRRFWQLSQLLVAQKETIEALADLLRVDWRLEPTVTRDDSSDGGKQSPNSEVQLHLVQYV
jgi:hypothetical protein